MKLFLQVFKLIDPWIVAVACCVINFLFDGLARISGILFVYIQNEFELNRQAASVPFVLSVAVRNLSGPIVGLIAKNLGPGSVTLLGGLVAFFGIGLCYFARNLTHLVIFWGILFGFGYGMGNTLLPVSIASYYKKHLALASGIAFSGSCFGSLLLPPVMKFLINSYGLHGTNLILSALILHCVPMALMIAFKTSAVTKEYFGIRIKKRDVKNPARDKVSLENKLAENCNVLQASAKSKWEEHLEQKISFVSCNSSGGSHCACTDICLCPSKSLSNCDRSSTVEKLETVMDLDEDNDDAISDAILDSLTKINDIRPKFSLTSNDYEPHETSHDVQLEIITVSDTLVYEETKPSSVLNAVGDDSNISAVDGGEKSSETLSSAEPNASINSISAENTVNQSSHMNLIKNEQPQTENHLQSQEIPLDVKTLNKMEGPLSHLDINNMLITKPTDSKLPLKLANRKSMPNLKVSIVECIVTVPDDMDYSYKKKKYKNYRRHANSVSYSIESPEFSFDPPSFRKTQSTSNLQRYGTKNENTSFKKSPKGKQDKPNWKRKLKPLRIFCDITFLSITLIMTFYEFIFVTMTTIVIDYFRDIGGQESNDHWVLIVFSIGNILGRFFLGPITDKHILEKNNFAAVCFGASGFLILATGITQSIKIFLVLIGLYGVFESGAVLMFPLLLKQYIAEKDFVVAVPSSFIGPGLIALVIPMIIGAFRDWSGSYEGLLYVISAASFLNVFVCLALPWLKKTRKIENC